ncbi:sodium:solute symporter family transporter [Natroniella sp. ANB-PHB2]|uniref:sodium:solute symporter family transporter n=1 Tax=Natroniella sp. ANB-PHB2 TaxID=3384444 RepID=UPI0038D49648
MGTIITISILYLLVVFGIGLWAMYQTKNSEDFFIAGKSLGLFVMAMATFATALSGFLFIGGPGLTYDLGMGALWFTFPTSISFAMAWMILGKKMRLLTEATGAMTVADAIYYRYDSNLARGIAGIVCLVGIVLFMSTQVLALGTIISFIFGISNAAGIIIGMGVVAFYSSAGGILAGTYTSAFQGTTMAIGSVLVFGLAMAAGGGMTNISQTIATTTFTGMETAMPEFIGPWGLVGPMVAMSWFFCLGIGIVGQPHVVSRFYMIEDLKKLKWGPVVAAIPAIVGGMLFFGAGLVVRYLVLEGAIEPLANSDDAIIFFVTEYAHPILAGIVLAGVSAAIMSTCDAFINIASAAAVRDIPFSLGKELSDEKQLSYGRVAVVVISIITVITVLSLGDRGIALLGAVGWGTFAAPLSPALGIGLNWKGATKEGAIASMLVGLALSVGLELLSMFDIYHLPHGIYIGALAMVVAIITFIVVSYMTETRELGDGMNAVLEV